MAPTLARPGRVAVAAGAVGLRSRCRAVVRVDAAAVPGLLRLLLRVPALPALCGQRLQQRAAVLVLPACRGRAEPALVLVGRRHHAAHVLAGRARA
ncbi:hypothetical protein G6F23_014336 [Rhizopus arrhizus]|nr:hypothetical protein G6F23_014336 [Rhizopus arrhizus]